MLGKMTIMLMHADTDAENAVDAKKLKLQLVRERVIVGPLLCQPVQRGLLQCIVCTELLSRKNNLDLVGRAQNCNEKIPLHICMKHRIARV